MTPNEKRIREIVQDQMKLEQHQRRTHASALQIDDSRVDAYRQIVQVLTGIDIFIHALGAS